MDGALHLPVLLIPLLPEQESWSTKESVTADLSSTQGELFPFESEYRNEESQSGDLSTEPVSLRKSGTCPPSL